MEPETALFTHGDKEEFNPDRWQGADQPGINGANTHGDNRTKGMVVHDAMQAISNRLQLTDNRVPESMYSSSALGRLA